MTLLSPDSLPSNIQTLFPIPLEPFEEYLLRDESRHFPMTWVYEWRFEGCAQRDFLEKAFREVVLYEPLLWAKVCKKRGRFYWELSEKPPRWEWHDHPGKTCDLGDSGIVNIVPVNVMHGPVMRVDVDCYDNALIIRCHVHHVVSDGLGIAKLVANWLALYANMLGDTDDGLKPFFCHPERVTERGQLNVTLPEPVSFSTAVRSLVREVVNWFRRRPVCLERTPIDKANDGFSNTETGELFPCLWRQLSPELGLAFRNRAKSLGLSVNSLFLGDVFLFLKKWSAEISLPQNKRRFFRILIPINMRNDFHKDIPASNILGYVFLDRSPEQCVNDKNFMATIDRDIQFIRDWSIGTMFLDGVRFFQRIPFALAYLASPRFCHSTTVVSNLGAFALALPQERFRREKTIRVPGLELKQLIGAPPVRPHTPITIGIITCGDRIFVNMTTEADYYRQGTADKFFNDCVDFLEQQTMEAVYVNH